MEDKWVIELIEQLAQFKEGEIGISRLAFSQADRQAREHIQGRMKDAGLDVRIDAAGNIIGRLAGKDPEAPAVATGSHLDTVPHGGKYDGVVGIAGGLLAIQRLQARGPLTHPVELVVFIAEEASRFGYSNLGSKAMNGTANIHAWSRAQDHSGITLKQAFLKQGLDLSAVTAAARKKEELKGFVELHIEQSRILEKTGSKIGIVEWVAASTRLKITVEGTAAHSGATPMDERQDALVSASMIVLAIQEISLEQSTYGTVGTVGAQIVHPGVMNAVPGMVEMWVDIRGVDHDSIIQTLQDIKDAISTIAEEQHTPVAMEVLSSEKPVLMDEHMVETIENVCRSRGVSYRLMNSGAGHDAMYMAHLTPTGMILIPCKNGLSHHPEESVATEDIMTGIDVLTEMLYRLAK
ncbi:peptidase m20 [Lucifera butyrica]|uniref:Peptidase m20 n=1 Tax=Lucifera butyrica TaxID=1351585 RepID=A0A498R4E7_9FIRM|nr:Zn-dependent hydrolase [Lucifera butyrica]VBB06304.1 peptidase m20 [Lucifera butyrica]